MSRLISILAAVVVLVMLAASTMFSVDQHRYAVLYALGELREVITEPGLHFKLPPPFQSVVYVDKRLQTLDTPDGERFATQEKKDLEVDAFVKWKIADARQYLGAVGGSNADHGGARMNQIVHSALNAEIARRSVADVLTGPRLALTDAVRQRVAADARALGVDVADLRLKRVGFSSQVNAALFERMKAERVRATGELRATGAADAENIRAEAERQRTVILAEGQRDAETIKGEGDAKAAQIYAQSFGKNPEFYRFYRSMEAYRAAFKGRSDILVVDPNSEFFKYFKGPGAGK